VSAGGTLLLLPERPPQGWAKVEWRVRLDTGSQNRILTTEKNKAAQFSRGPFSGRAIFQEETLSLRISRVSPADSGVYKAEFEETSGVVTAPCFHVSVWEPVRQPRLEARILHREQGWCNLSLVCIVPCAGNVSYSWSCGGGPLGALEHQPQLHLQVHGDADPTVCCCNVSNPVSWGTASADITVACRAVAPGLFSVVPWWAVAVSLGLALATCVAFVVTCYWCRKRGKEPPGGPIEQTLTVYEEVGKAQTSQDPSGTGEATVGGNTIYAVVCTKTQGASRPQEPESCTIYSTIQPARKVSQPGAGFTTRRARCLTAGSRSAPQSPSLKRKRLDPALVSTAYVE
ncbi:PREDICTED: natural killer cell receptor 2B4, partial [Phaethon lepturus]|uniref:natural killer cell receptor 2B4 n=1 Tax=Phaethon lepturus TaxID=97097 RepID=UPI000530519A